MILITFSPLTWSVFVLNTLWNLFAFFSQILRKFFSFIVLFVKIKFVSVLYHDIYFRQYIFYKNYFNQRYAQKKSEIFDDNYNQ